MPARVTTNHTRRQTLSVVGGCARFREAMLRDYPMMSPAAALRMLRGTGVSPSMMAVTTTRTTVTTAWAAVTAWATTRTAWPATTARTTWATTTTGTEAGAAWAEAWTTWTKARPKTGMTWPEARAYAGTRTPSAPAAGTAPAEAAAPSVAAPVPAGSAPTVEIETITPAAEPELRPLKRRGRLACRNAELVYRHRLRWCGSEQASREPDA
jgi:hypothetical protein